MLQDMGISHGLIDSALFTKMMYYNVIQMLLLNKSGTQYLLFCCILSRERQGV